MAVEMNDQVKRAYQIMQNPYYQNVSDSPAVELVIENSDVPSRKSGNEQQKLASQRPRGTRIDDTGTRLQVKGGRNYTSRKLFIGRDELYDDVVIRGLRADGLSTKLGVKNHKDGIAQMLTSLFQDDPRLPVIEEHFKTQRQKSNCAKTMFATMTHEELQFLKAETFPSRIDVQVRDYLTNAFSEQPEKLQSTVEVLGQIQRIFKLLTPHAEFLSNHNFQTRGFFLDIVLMTCSFLMQIIQDSDGNPEPNFKAEEIENKLQQSGLSPNVEEKVVKEVPNKTAAEILLTVGSDILDNPNTTSESIQASDLAQSASVLTTSSNQPTATSISQSNLEGDNPATSAAPTTVVVEGAQKQEGEEDYQWTVEMVDGNGNSRYVLIKTDNDDPQSINTVKILDMIQSQGISLDDTIEVALANRDESKAPTKPPDEDSIEDVDDSDKLTLVLDAEPSSGLLVEGKLTTAVDEDDQLTAKSPDIDVESTNVHLAGDTENANVDLEPNEEDKDTTQHRLSIKNLQDAQKRKLTVTLPATPKRSRKR